MNKFVLSLSVSLCDANTQNIHGHGTLEQILAAGLGDARWIRTLHRSYASAESK